MTNWLRRGRPELSVVVVVHNLKREAPRTLHSLSAAYQRDIAADDYEVIVVDNGSTPPLDPEMVGNLVGNFRLLRLDPAPPSPAHAINVGLAAARGEIVGVMIDGARIVTPGLLHFARGGARLCERAVVCAMGWYLGLDHQSAAIECGYDTSREDALLASIEWPNDGYRLFEIGALDESSIDGAFAQIAESNSLFLHRRTWADLSGADERFDAPGGGFLNLDMLSRALELPRAELVILLGEGTFHQLHGGIATNARFDDLLVKLERWAAQYLSIRGKPWAPPPQSKRTYLGVLPRAALLHFARSVIEPARTYAGEPPLGGSFDQQLWSLDRAPEPRDAVARALTALAEQEFRSRRFEAAAEIARMARTRAPDEPAPQRLLAQASSWFDTRSVPDAERAGFHLARAKAFRLLDKGDMAEAEFRQALAFDGDLVEAHLGICELRLPGPGYLDWLTDFHQALAPESYLEIGVGEGRSIALASPPTCTIGVDPEPRICWPPQTECHIYSERSDEFFASKRLAVLLAGRPLALVFVDGSHMFQQSLRDFINAEAFCGTRSVVLFHDTIPFDDVTQRPDRQRKFYTGDVWKTVLCLRRFRPDLDVFTVSTPPSGLTVVTGLDPTSRVLADNFDSIVAQLGNVPYAEVERTMREKLNVVPNNWTVVERRLRERGVLDGPLAAVI